MPFKGTGKVSRQHEAVQGEAGGLPNGKSILTALALWLKREVWGKGQ